MARSLSPINSRMESAFSLTSFSSFAAAPKLNMNGKKPCFISIMLPIIRFSFTVMERYSFRFWKVRLQRVWAIWCALIPLILVPS